MSGARAVWTKTGTTGSWRLRSGLLLLAITAVVVLLMISLAEGRAAEPTLNGPSTVDYPENSTLPVATYSASDSDGGVFSWSLDGTDQMFFTLIEGELAFKQPPNYENSADGNEDNNYLVEVVATDSQGESASIVVTVTVTDVKRSQRRPDHGGRCRR